MQAWLPGAYGSTDGDSAGFIAAVSINVAFYAMLRVWFGFLGHPAAWWAAVALLLGAATALIGILGGVLQRRLRLFVAYSSIENAGIIVADLGLALMGSADHQPGLMGVGLIAATFQIVAHSVAKAALFTAVGAVERSTGTSDMERLGGLWRSLPAVHCRDALRRRRARGAATVQRVRRRVVGSRRADAGVPRRRHRLARRDRRDRRDPGADRRPGGARVRARPRDDVPRNATRPEHPASSRRRAANDRRCCRSRSARSCSGSRRRG